MGIHAMGEMGRSIWKIGFKVRYAPATHPIHSPRGIATQTANMKPAPTRIREAAMCRHNVPSLSSSRVPVTTAHGVGKITLCVTVTVVHHAAISAAMSARDGNISLIRAM
jgi:hypothetical protein